MRRRQFITLLGAAAGWPLATLAQQPERMRRIGVLGGTAANDIDAIARIRVTVETLRQLGWTEGHNVQIDARQSAGDAGQGRKYAAELVALAPDVILAIGSVSARSLLGRSRRFVRFLSGAAGELGDIRIRRKETCGH